MDEEERHRQQTEHAAGSLAAAPWLKEVLISVGTVVPGGLVAGPDIAVLGLVMDTKADKNLDIACGSRVKVEAL